MTAPSHNQIAYSKAVVQKPAPQFVADAVINGEIKQAKLSNHAGKYVFLIFYPKDFTFVCPTELIAFNDRLAEFQALNVDVAGVSTDSAEVHLAWINTPRKEGGLGSDFKLPLISDKNLKISRDYGVLIEDEGIALRGQFLIDGKQNLRQATINDLPVGRSVEEALRLVKAFQYTDKHGEVCPANWNEKSNSATIKPNPKGSKEYFASVNK